MLSWWALLQSLVIFTRADYFVKWGTHHFSVKLGLPPRHDCKFWDVLILVLQGSEISRILESCDVWKSYYLLVEISGMRKLSWDENLPDGMSLPCRNVSVIAKPFWSFEWRRNLQNIQKIVKQIIITSIPKFLCFHVFPKRNCHSESWFKAAINIDLEIIIYN